MKYPKTPVKPVTETLNGKTLIDNYRWLEDDNDRMLQWSNQQNELVATHLEQDPRAIQYEDEIMQLISVDTQSAPVVRRGRYFFGKQGAEQDNAMACYQDGLDGEHVVIVDPNAITAKTGEPTALMFWSASPSGRYVSYGLIVKGHEMTDLIVLDLNSNKEVVRLPYHRSSANWLPDESGFYHSQFPDPKTVPKGEDFYHVRVHFYDMNTKMSKEVFGKGMHKETAFGTNISPDGEQIIVSTSRGWRKNDLYVAKTGDNVFRPLITDYDAIFHAYQLDDRVIMVTNYQAPNQRILMSRYDAMPSKPEAWEEIVPESKDALMDWGATSRYLVVEYLHNVASQVKLLTYDGEPVDELYLPPLSSLTSLHTNREEEEFFYSFGNFLAMQTIYRFNPETSKGELFREPQRSLDPKLYEAVQEWYTSKDGTKIPMFLVRKKGLKPSKQNKLALYGYGGFKNAQTPSYTANWIPFIENGGIFAIANIRGGGEFGRAWHEGGVRENKQTSFDDFIAAAEYVIDKDYTSSPHLAIAGGSNGGLLVAACMTQRPELFGAVVCRVPLIDMVRFPKFLMASRWIEEYGDPENKVEFERILKWSPYHNIKTGIDYPPTLITTGINDNRVAPLHARKLAAALQGATKTNPVYLFTDTERGHGPGAGRRKLAHIQGVTLAFLDQVL